MKILLIWLLGVAAAVAIAWGLSGRPERGRIRAARTFAPCALLMTILASTLGAWDRRRLRSGVRHASPSIAWLAKRGALAAAGGAVVWAATPLPWPAWSFYLLSAVAAACAGLYVAHLPTRL